jgi:cephalosporin hydroxylase
MKTPKFISNILIRRGFQKLVKTIQQNYHQTWTAEKTIDFLFSKEAALIQPWQFTEEMTGLAKEIEAIRPKVVVEIGTANGGTLFMACRLAAPDATIVSIDLPGGAFGGGFPDWKIPIYSSFASPGQKIHLLRGNSHSKEMFDQLTKILDGKKIDYLFIDGDHSYEGVKQDFITYKELTAPHAKIAFHDIVKHHDDDCNVHKLWFELRDQYPHKEYVKDWNQKYFGIGVLLK